MIENEIRKAVNEYLESTSRRDNKTKTMRLNDIEPHLLELIVAKSKHANAEDIKDIVNCVNDIYKKLSTLHSKTTSLEAYNAKYIDDKISSCVIRTLAVFLSIIAAIATIVAIIVKSFF